MANKKLSAAKKRYAELKKKEQEQAESRAGTPADPGASGDDSKVEGSDQRLDAVEGEPESEEPETESKETEEPEKTGSEGPEPQETQLETELEPVMDSTATEPKPESEPLEAKQPSQDAELDAFDAAIAPKEAQSEAPTQEEQVPQESDELKKAEPLKEHKSTKEAFKPTEHEHTEPEHASPTHKPTHKPTPSLDSELALSEQLITVQEENDRLKAHILTLENRIQSLETEVANYRSGSNEDDLEFTPPFTQNSAAASRTAPDMFSESTNISSIRESMNGFKDFRLDMRNWHYMSGIGPIVSI